MSESASTPSPQQIPATWDAVAPTYAEDAAQWDAYVIEALRTVPVGASDRVLDIATGPGTLALAAAKHAARVDAVDFSPGMIEEVRARALRDGVKNIEAAVMDAHELDFPDASFDAAFCIFGFFFFQDRARVFRQMHRLLRPSGRALIATWSPIERRPIMKLGFEAIAEALPQFPRPTKGDLQDPAECVREMTEAGFREVETHLFTASVRLDTPEQYLEMLVRSGAPFAAMKKKLGEAAFAALKAPILEAIERRFPKGGGDLAAEAIFTRAIK